MPSESVLHSRIQLLGPFRLVQVQRTTTRFRRNKEVLLLGYLALNPQRPHPRERLIDLLWPDADLNAGRVSLSTALSALRRELEPAGIATGSVLLADRQTVAINPECITTDVAEFDALLDQARNTAAVAERTHLLEQAVALYRGDLLEGFYEDWSLSLQSAYRDRFREALVDWAQDLETQQEWEGAQRAAARAMEVDALQEDAILVLMRVLARQGQATRAIDMYRAFQDRLCDELGADPTQVIQLFAERLQCAPDSFVARMPPTQPFASPFAADVTAPGLQTAEAIQPEASAAEGTEAEDRDEVASSLMPPNNLPNWLTSFVGREREIEEVCGLLGQTRLLTLTGIGGCGKTRLAVRVASEVQRRYPQGVWLVELAALSGPSPVAQSVADVLGVREVPGASMLGTLSSALKGKRLLLVLDNCEHVLDACAVLAEAVLRSCPDVGVLATSREALGLGGERAYRVPPLSCPPPFPSPLTKGGPRAVSSLKDGDDGSDFPPYEGGTEGGDFASLTRYESVRLFLERVSGAGTGFTLTAENASSLASLCSRLDGLPLAIELAASRVRSMPLEQIEGRLDDRFRLLIGGSRAALPRQRTLKALIDWSYDLLTEAERALLRRLSVFAGGWTLAAAEAVCGDASNFTTEDTEGHRGTAPPQHPEVVLDLLTSLVDKSLVIYEEREGKARYRLLETVRQYAMDRLVESGESDGAQGRHRDCFLALAEEAEPKLKGPTQTEWFERLEQEHDNLRAALQWSLQPSSRLLHPLRFCGALERFWLTRGHLREGREWCTRALGAVAAQERTQERAKALLGQGNLAEGQGDYAAARASFAESLDIAREIGDRRGIGVSLHGLGSVALRQGDYELAQTYYEQSLEISRELGNRSGVAGTLCNLGIIAKNQGDYVSARAYYEESLALFREIGHRHYLANSLNGLGAVAALQGDDTSAHAYFEESLDIYRELGDRGGIAVALGDLGLAAQEQGDYASAHAYYEESLDIDREIGDRNGIGCSLHNLGSVALRQGDYASARTYYKESLAIFREIGHREHLANALDGMGFVTRALGDTPTARAYHEESLVVRREIGDQCGVAKSLEALAGLAAEEGRSEQAAVLCAASEALREEISAPRSSEERESYDREVAAVRQVLGEEAFSTAWANGRAMTLEEAIALALEQPIKANQSRSATA